MSVSVQCLRRPVALGAVAVAALVPAVSFGANAAQSGSIKVTSPRAGSTIKGSAVVMRLSTGKFKVTSQATTVRRNEGHFHVFLDKRPFVAVYSKVFRFRGLKPGSHRLKVEPVNSAHKPAAGYRAIVVRFTTTR